MKSTGRPRVRNTRQRYPKVKDIGFVHRTLQLIRVDTPITGGWRESEKGVPNFRFQGQSNESRWTVDVYAGDYYIVRVGDRLTEECTSVQSILLYLYRMLRIEPEPAQPSNRETV